jgi:hypothetical protein
MASESSGYGYELGIPEEILRAVPDEIKSDDVRYREYLLSALKIGLRAMANAGISLSTDEIERAIRESVDEHQKMEEDFQELLENLIRDKLTGDDSRLAIKLGEYLGKNGELKKRLEEIFLDLTDPEKKKSVPNRVAEVMQERFDGVEEEITSALDLTSQDSLLKKFLDLEKQRFDNLAKELRDDMGEIRIALDVDRKLAQMKEDIDTRKKKSTGKGDDFEVDAVEHLEKIANHLGDSVEHTGGEAADGSYAKVGDITIRINEVGLPEDLGIAIEAKSGGYALKDLQRQMKAGMQQRNCDAAIGLVTRYGKGTKQHSEYHEDFAYGIVSTVEWLANEREEADWITLEVAYRVTRNRLIAAHRTERDANSVDIVELENQINGIKTQLSSMQAMKVNSSKARELIAGVRESLDTLESEVMSHLTRMEKTLQAVDDAES